MANGNNVNIQNRINELERLIVFYQDKINKINTAVSNLNECLNAQGSNGSNIYSQGENTFQWLKDNLDVYWTDMVGETKKECEKYFDFLTNSSTSPIALVKAESTNVLNAANDQIEKYNAKIEEINNEIYELQAQLDVAES